MKWHKIKKENQGETMDRLTQKELDKILASQNTDLNNNLITLDKKDCTEVNFFGKVLKNIAFHYCNLSEVDFSDAILKDVEFMECELNKTLMINTTLVNVTFKKSNLTEVDFSDAIIKNNTFNWVNLNSAKFFDSHLTYTDFYKSNLENADFSSAQFFDYAFTRTDLSTTMNVPTLNCPSQGSFIGWKKCEDNDKYYIVKLEIPANAKRSSGISKKCRAEKAKVLAIETIDEKPTDLKEIWSSHNLKYIVGEMVYPNRFDINRWNECSHGIHFFIDREDAVRYLK